MEELTLQIRGTSPMLHSNVRLVDPLNPYTKKLEEAVADARAKKTDAARIHMRRVEFEGSMYHDAQLGPYIPSEAVLRTLRDAAALVRKGKGIERGVVADTDKIVVTYDGPRDIQAIWDAGMYDVRAVVVGMARVMRTRPCFPSWEAKAKLLYHPKLINKKDLVSFAEEAGTFLGLGSGRRIRFGRFEVLKAS